MEVNKEYSNQERRFSKEYMEKRVNENKAPSTKTNKWFIQYVNLKHKLFKKRI